MVPSKLFGLISLTKVRAEEEKKPGLIGIPLEKHLCKNPYWPIKNFSRGGPEYIKMRNWCLFVSVFFSCTVKMQNATVTTFWWSKVKDAPWTTKTRSESRVHRLKSEDFLRVSGPPQWSLDGNAAAKASKHFLSSRFHLSQDLKGWASREKSNCWCANVVMPLVTNEINYFEVVVL